MIITKVNDTQVTEVKALLETEQVKLKEEISTLGDSINAKSKELEIINRKLRAIESFEL